MRVLILALASCSLALVLASAAPSADRGWTVTDLGVGPGSTASAVNDGGQVVGNTSTRGGFVWDHGTATYLGPGTVANAINDRGDVVGSYYNGSTTHPVVWHDGAMSELPLLAGGSFGWALAINNSGDIVGQADVSPGFAHAVLWRAGQAIDLGTLCITRFICYSGAHAINERGVVVGQSITEAGATHAFIWKDGAMTDLDTLDRDSRAFAINNRGDIVGSNSPTGLCQCAVLWHNGTIDTLALDSVAYAVNNRGQVAGVTLVGGIGGTWTGFVWDNGVTTYLPSSPGGGTQVTAINNRGQVAGSTGSAGEPGHAVIYTRD